MGLILHTPDWMQWESMTDSFPTLSLGKPATVRLLRTCASITAVVQWEWTIIYISTADAYPWLLSSVSDLAWMCSNHQGHFTPSHQTTKLGGTYELVSSVENAAPDIVWDASSTLKDPPKSERRTFTRKRSGSMAQIC